MRQTDVRQKHHLMPLPYVGRNNNTCHTYYDCVLVVEAAADGSQSDGSVLDYALCVDKVLHMQRLFLTERDDGAGRQPSGTSSASVPAGELEDKDACMTDTAVSSGPAAESDEVTSHIDAGDDDVLCVKPR